MREGRIAAFVLALSLALAPALAQRNADPQDLSAFAAQLGLRAPQEFVDAVEALRAVHRLPPRYVTKWAAPRHGWHGGGLCEIWPEHVIGGDRFDDFGSPLPSAPGRLYREADLDSDCDSRGPKRLVFSNDGLIFGTIDHYRSFVAVP